MVLGVCRRIQALEGIQDDEYKAYALGYLAKAQVKAGDEPGTLALAARQTVPLRKTYALLGVAEGRTKQRATKE